MENQKYIDPEAGQIVFKDGKRIGELVLLQEPDNYGIKLDNSEWSVNLQLFLWMHGDDDITVIPKEKYQGNVVVENGYEYKDGEWKKTLRDLFHKYF